MISSHTLTQEWFDLSVAMNGLYHEEQNMVAFGMRGHVELCKYSIGLQVSILSLSEKKSFDSTR